VKDNDYFVVVNASNKDKDFAWMKDHSFGDVRVLDVSDSYAQIALQGPKAEGILARLTDRENIPAVYYTALFDRPVGGISCMVSRTGYIGEDGFELYLKPEDACRMWELLLDAGRDDGLIPCGLGARDTLRLEAGMPLYGHELSSEISPVAAGLGMFVKLQKEDFIGKEALAAAGKPKRRRVGLKVIGKGIAREHQEILKDGNIVGMTTSGTHCPWLGAPFAMAMVDEEFSSIGEKLVVMVRQRAVEAEVVKLPFYRRKKAKKA
ncbi:MAG: glycine cleavage system aminomethyltransferase GcvT, partial [Parasporobacterium sp.]|nr:glycine cleavage system aminomethyltransferase GcvT [Parasporobacterium sp.]